MAPARHSCRSWSFAERDTANCSPLHPEQKYPKAAFCPIGNNKPCTLTHSSFSSFAFCETAKPPLRKWGVGFLSDTWSARFLSGTTSPGDSAHSLRDAGSCLLLQSVVIIPPCHCVIGRGILPVRLDKKCSGSMSGALRCFAAAASLHDSRQYSVASIQ